MPDKPERWVAAGLRKLERAGTLDALTMELLRMLCGVPPSIPDNIDVDDYIMAVRAAAPRRLREDIDAATLGIIRRIAEHEPIDDDNAVDAFLLASEVFADRERTDVLALLVHILTRPRRYSAVVAVAAGQCALVLGYRGVPAHWRELHTAAGERAVPTVMRGLGSVDWHQLGDWISEQRGDAWVERTYINLLPAFVASHGAERVRDLVARVSPVISRDGSEEVAQSLARLGIAETPTRVATPAPDWDAAIDKYVEDVHDVPPAEFFGAMCARSANPRRAERAFVMELKEFLQPWQIEDREPTPQDARMLRLIEAFLPSGGFEKAVDALRRHLDRGTTDAASVEIAEAAMAVVRRTYRRPPPRTQKDPAFMQCVALLHELAGDSVAGPAAIQHLMRLDQAKFKDAEFVAAVMKSDESIVAAVDAAMDPRNDQQLTCILNAILDQRFAAGFDAFLNRIRKHEAQALPVLNQIRIPPQSVVIVAQGNMSEFSKLTIADRERHLDNYLKASK